MRLPATDTSILGKPSAALAVLSSQLCISLEIMAIYATSITSGGRPVSQSPSTAVTVWREACQSPSTAVTVWREACQSLVTAVTVWREACQSLFTAVTVLREALQLLSRH